MEAVGALAEIVKYWVAYGILPYGFEDVCDGLTSSVSAVFQKVMEDL